MKNIFPVSVILPIKSSKAKDFEEYFEKAINSCINQSDVAIEELLIVHTPEETLVNFLDSYDFKDLNVRKILFEDEPNFCSQINYGVQNAKSEWVSFLEFDDEYATIWFRNVAKYAKYYKEESAFMPLVIDTEGKNNFVGFTNEAAFAANFSQEMGVLTNEMLQNYQNFQSSGMVIKKSVFEEFGGFKPSFKLTFVYEFLLRMTYNSVNPIVIPRVGYKHINMREGSIFWNYKFGDNKITEDEVKFWLQAAKKEYFFTADRKVKYGE
jgi:glycosyltransferase involved in cell wall biosynthesis